MRAAAPACSLARALRALGGDLSWERLGRVALLENAPEILPTSLLEASRDLPELTLAILGLILALLGVIWGLLGLMLGLLSFPFLSFPFPSIYTRLGSATDRSSISVQEIVPHVGGAPARAS